MESISFYPLLCEVHPRFSKETSLFKTSEVSDPCDVMFLYNLSLDPM